MNARQPTSYPHRPLARSCRRAMTLMELLLAMMVMGLVLAGVTSLAFALSSVKDSSDDTSRKQAYLRFTMVQIAELIKHSKLVCYASDSEVLLWTTDTNLDGKINTNEVVSLWTDGIKSKIIMSRFAAHSGVEVPLASVGSQASLWWQAFGATASEVEAVPECTDVSFFTDAAAPGSQYVSIAFNLTQNGQTARFTVSGKLCARSGNLLDTSNNIVADDD
jgi:prepilin-type N-terminal cleavage/methylation domain-containing protein